MPLASVVRHLGTIVPTLRKTLQCKPHRVNSGSSRSPAGTAVAAGRNGHAELVSVVKTGRRRHGLPAGPGTWYNTFGLDRASPTRDGPLRTGFEAIRAQATAASIGFECGVMAKPDPTAETTPTFEAAIVKRQGVTFAIVAVNKQVLDQKIVAGRTRSKLKPLFGNLPIVLMAQDADGTPTYYGRKDLVRFLTRIKLKDVPWKEYTITPCEK